MSLENTAQSPIVHAVDGVDVSFARFTVYDIGKLAAKFRADTQAAMKKALLDTPNLAPLDAYKERRLIECFTTTLGDVLQRTNDPEYATGIVEESLKKAGCADVSGIISKLNPLTPAERKSDEDVPLPGIGALAREILGLADRLPPVAKAKEDKANPLAFGQTATG